MVNHKEYVEVNEGLVKLIVPNPELFKRPNGIYEPSWAPVFYNPRMILNRDLSIVVLNAFTNLHLLKGVIALDALAGTGVRGLRYVKEIANVEKSLINDIDPNAYKLMLKNVKINELEHKVEVFNKDANILMNELKIEKVKVNIVDIDPFGTPIPFLQSALWLITRNGILGVTATDMAVLTGKHSHALLRKYRVIGFKTDFKKEFAARVLISTIAFRAAEMDKVIIPLFTISTDHYVRVFAMIEKGGRKASEMIKKGIGYILYCTKCGFRKVITYTNSEEELICSYCKSKLSKLGPLWIGNLYDEEMVIKSLNSLNTFTYMQSYNKLIKLFKIVSQEYRINNIYYSLPEICSKVKLNIPKISSVIKCLKEKGFETSRTHMDSQAIKTNANHKEFIDCLIV